MNADEVLARLQAMGSPAGRAGMGRFGIKVDNALGISVHALRELAREIGTDHTLALQLWRTGIHEARILATVVADPGAVTSRQLDTWARDFDSWDVVDQCALNLIRKTPLASKKVEQWSRRPEEFIKRAGFAVMAGVAAGDKKAGDELFESWLGLVEAASSDERNFVRKAVNWALRQIGKRNRELNERAVAVARRLRESDSHSARWIGSDAERELTSDKVRAKL